MNEGIHLDLDTWIVLGQIRKANLCRGLGNRYTPAGTEVWGINSQLLSMIIPIDMQGPHTFVCHLMHRGKVGKVGNHNGAIILHFTINHVLPL